MGGTSGSKQSSQSQTSYDPDLKDAYLANYSKAQQTAATPVQPYSGPLSADFSGTPLDQAKTGFADLSHFSVPQVSAGQLASTDLTPYLNPYQGDVINTTMSQLARQYGIDQTGANAQATAAGAFGGSRSAVLSGLVNDNYQRNLNQTVSNLNAQNFNQAQGAATTDIGNRLTADTSNAGYRLQGAGIQGNANAALAGIAGQEQQAKQSGVLAAYQEWMRQQNWPLQMQQLLTQAAGALPNGTVGTSSSTGKSSSWQITPPNISIAG